MRIACIAPSEVPSNTANSIQVMKACHAMAQLGHEVCLWVPGNPGPTWEQLAEHYGLETPFEIRWVPSWLPLRRYDFVLKALGQAQRWHADAVYTWLSPAALFAVWRHMPALLELHDRPMGHFGPWIFKQLVRTQGRKRFLLITEALHNVLIREFDASFAPGEVVITPNGVELERFANLPAASEARHQLGLDECLTATFSGHFYAGRGTGLLFGLAQALPEIQFLWVGGRQQDVADWRERLKSAGVHNVIVTGFIENRQLPLYLAAADVLLMPFERKITGSSGGNSADICSPMKLFEYLAAGRAIMSSDLPVIHEILNERNGVFCPPEDLSAWQEGLSQLMQDTTKRQRIAAQARQDASQYSWKLRAGKALAGFIIPNEKTH
jgi:glycosyltransferase involved in cell wall biosynthesis